MFDRNQTSAYEPYPLWGCEHNWMLIGGPIVKWASGYTDDNPPVDSPAIQKRQCLKCGGFEWISIGCSD